jgi:excisionase family DNA binding protein
VFDCSDAPDGALAPPLSLASARSQGPVTRRLYRLDEAAELVGEAHSTIKSRANLWRLPVVRIEALTANPARHAALLVPALWIPRWLEMANRDKPVLTSREDYLAATEGPYYMGVPAAAKSLGVSADWVWRAIRLGRFPHPVTEGADMRVSRMKLDEWVYGLIRRAECEWYRIAGEVSRPRLAIPARGVGQRVGAR